MEKMFREESRYGSIPLSFSEDKAKSRTKKNLVWSVIGLMCLLSLALNMYELLGWFGFGNGKLAVLNDVDYSTNLVLDTQAGYTSTLFSVTVGQPTGKKNIINKDNNGPIIKICTTDDSVKESIVGTAIHYRWTPNNGEQGNYVETIPQSSLKPCPCPEDEECWEAMNAKKHIHGVTTVWKASGEILGFVFRGEDGDESPFQGPYATLALAQAEAGAITTVWNSGGSTTDYSSVLRKIKGKYTAPDQIHSIDWYFGQRLQPDSTVPATGPGWAAEDDLFGDNLATLGNNGIVGSQKYQIYKGNNAPIRKICVAYDLTKITGIWIGYSPNFQNSGNVGANADPTPPSNPVPGQEQDPDVCLCPAETCFAPSNKQMESVEVYWKNDDIKAMQLGSKNNAELSGWFGFIAPVLNDFINFDRFEAHSSSNRCIRKIRAYEDLGDGDLNSLDFYYGQPEQ